MEMNVHTCIVVKGGIIIMIEYKYLRMCMMTYMCICVCVCLCVWAGVKGEC